MADLKTSCMKELRMNNTLKEPGPEGGPSIASIVKNKICDGNPPCSNNGDCVNGKCLYTIVIFSGYQVIVRIHFYFK